MRALVPNPALQDADVVAAGQAGSFATPSVRMTSTSTSHDLTLDNAPLRGSCAAVAGEKNKLMHASFLVGDCSDSLSIATSMDTSEV